HNPKAIIPVGILLHEGRGRVQAHDQVHGIAPKGHEEAIEMGLSLGAERQRARPIKACRHKRVEAVRGKNPGARQGRPSIRQRGRLEDEGIGTVLTVLLETGIPEGDLTERVFSVYIRNTRILQRYWDDQLSW